LYVKGFSKAKRILFPKQYFYHQGRPKYRM
jgi:hypothetical protein